MTTKTCTECGGEKPPTEFYGKDSNCKECRKAKVRAYRQANIEAVKAYDRERGRDEKRRSAVKERRPRYREKHNEVYAKAWIAKNPEKRKAHGAVWSAIRSGKLIKQPCEVCGEIKVEAHHDDYTKPLDVRWLCPAHHGKTRRIDEERA